MNIVWKGSPNFNKGRAGKKVKKIVIHWFGKGTLESANTRFQNAANKASAHYGISKGRIWQWVKEADTAFHAGDLAVNRETIGIEHDAGIDPLHDLSEQDYLLSGQLLAEISKRHGIPLNHMTVIGHREIKPTQCPGTINLDKIISIANQILNPMIKVPILGIKYKIPDEPFFQQTVDYALNWLSQVTNNELTVTLDMVDRSDRTFTVIQTDNTDGIAIYMVKPEEIAAIGSEMETANQRQYSIVTLLANKQQLSPQPGNDVANPGLYHGFAISQKWYQLPGGQVDVNANFIIHEWLHNFYHILNAKGVPLVDDVHQHSTIFDADPSKNLSDIVLKLKPHWPLLASAGQGEGMIQRQEDVKILRINVNGTRGVLKIVGGRQLVGELASSPADYDGLEDNYGVPLVKPDGTLEPVDANINF